MWTKVNLKKLINKIEAQDKLLVEPYSGLEGVPITPARPVIPDLEENEDEWNEKCFPPSDHEECLERQAELFVILAELLAQQHSQGCNLGPKIQRGEHGTWWPSNFFLDCYEGDQPEQCDSICFEINNVLQCISQFIHNGCPEEEETEGCCCWCLYCDMTVEEQMKLLEEWNAKEEGITETDWQRFFDGTFCTYTREDFCNWDGGEFYPGTSEGECESLACPPNCT